MVSLNLPSFEYQLKKEGDKVWIFDVIRKKYLVLTPEEWVRQHFVHYLIVEMKYPKALIKLEGGLTYNTLAKRSDIVVFDRKGKPWMVVECKAPEQTMNEATLRQASMYNKKLLAPYLTISNGLKTFFFEINFQTGNTIQLSTPPAYGK